MRVALSGYSSKPNARKSKYHTMSQLSLWLHSHRYPFNLASELWFYPPVCYVDGHARDLSVHAILAQLDGSVKAGEALCLQRAAVCVLVSGNCNRV